MNETENPLDNLIHQLRERAKELNCMYEVQELQVPEITIEEVCQGIIRALPPGWQYPDVCGGQIVFGSKAIKPRSLKKAAGCRAPLFISRTRMWERSACVIPKNDLPRIEGPFLKEERKLINTIAEQFGFFLLHQQLRQVFQEQFKEGERKSDWGVILDMLKATKLRAADARNLPARW